MVHRPVRFHLLYPLLDLHFHSSLSGDDIGWRAFGNSNPKLCRSTFEPSPSHPGANMRREHPRTRIRRKENNYRVPVHAGAACAASAGGALCACASSMRYRVTLTSEIVSTRRAFRTKSDPRESRRVMRTRSTASAPCSSTAALCKAGGLSRQQLLPTLAGERWFTLAAARATCSMVTAFGAPARPTVAHTALCPLCQTCGLVLSAVLFKQYVCRNDDIYVLPMPLGLAGIAIEVPFARHDRRCHQPPDCALA